MKAILVIDMPNTCQDCQFRNHNQCYVFSVNRTLLEEWDGTDEFKTRNKICPLKPMPEEIQTISNEEDVYLQGRRDGWNDCIDEILGGNYEANN